MTRTILRQVFVYNSAHMLYWGISVIYGKDVWQSPLYNFEER